MTHDFPFGQTELSHLSSADPAMAALIACYEEAGERPARPVEEDVFVALMRAINDQLISLEAAAAIWGRITDRFGDPILPETFAQVTPDEIHACGTTRKKAEYMHGISSLIVSGDLDLEALRSEPDEQVIKELTALRGIGLWSAEMLLIHAYERPDVISYGDAAIRRGVCMLNGIEGKISKRQFDELTAKYAPYRTTASIYFWRLSKE